MNITRLAPKLCRRAVLFLTLLFLTSVPRIAQANDSASSGIGGRWRMLKSEHRQVQMVSEHVRIIAQPSGDFQTTADFVFRNHGPATTVTMGFPEKRGGDAASDILSLFKFKTWVDGQRVTARRRKIIERESEFEALWVKKVRFERNATRRVRVRYLSSSGGGYSNGEQWVAYDFTGGNWRGKVRESVLDVRFRPGWYRVSAFPDDMKARPHITRKGGRFRFRWTNWQAQQEFVLNYWTVFPNELARKVKIPYGMPMHLVVEPGKLAAISYRRECPPAILWKGRLWVHAQAMANCEWSEKRKGMIMRLGKRAFFVSARGAAWRSERWPVHPDRPFWATWMGNQFFYVPARLVAKKLGGTFTLRGDKAIYRNGRYRKVL